MNIVVYVAHVDDEILYCGGTIAKFISENHQVFIVWANNGIVVHGRPGVSYRQESEKIATCLGVPLSNCFFLNIPTMEFDKYGQLELNKRFESLGLKFDLIITHSEHDINEDHRIVFKSALVQARCYGRPVGLLCCEYLGGSTTFAPNLYVNIEKFMNKKLLTLEKIVCEMREFPHQRSIEAIEAKARVRGSECGCKYAEAFEVKRWLL